ncbi:MAG: GNAT family N-acetyltransferase [Chloroflexi bacterium]|nr:GNAT family N-acetyltransferase [Chloroflexota bacterium]
MDSYYRLTGDSLRRVICRPARSADRVDVFSFVRNIWDGEDYIPYVWEAWLADPEGQLTVAEYGGRAVGLSKLTRLGAQQWWMEGLRVDPQHQGKGIASLLMDYTVDLWQHTGSGVVRLATSSRREKVHHMCVRFGFEKIGEYTEFVAEPLAEPVANFRQLQGEEILKALAVIRNSPISIHWFHQLMEVGWSWAEPEETLVGMPVNEGKAWWWKEEGSLLLLRDDDDADGKVFPWIEILTCAPGDLVPLLMDYRRLAARLNYPSARWTAPLEPEVLRGLEAAGFKRNFDDNLFIYEKRK